MITSEKQEHIDYLITVGKGGDNGVMSLLKTPEDHAQWEANMHWFAAALLESSPLLPQQGREQTDKLQELAELACMLADDAPMKIQTGLLLISAELGEMVDAAVLPQVGEAKPNNELIQVADRHLCAAYQAGSEGIEFDLLRAIAALPVAAEKRVVTQTEMIAWANRHDISAQLNGSPRAAFEDAATLYLTNIDQEK